MREKIAAKYNKKLYPYCFDENEIRKLESDYSELEKKNEVLKGADLIIRELEKEYPDWKSYRDILDCILVHKSRNIKHTSQSDYAELEKKLQIATEGLEIFSNLKTAYPESVFPPIGKLFYHGMCKASGISVDRVSAHVLRSVTKGYAELADETIDKINKT